jgi:hypothetical protein
MRIIYYIIFLMLLINFIISLFYNNTIYNTISVSIFFSFFIFLVFYSYINIMNICVY